MPSFLSGCLVGSGCGKSGIGTGSYLRRAVWQRYSPRQYRAFRVSCSRVIATLTRSELTVRVSPLSSMSQWLRYALWSQIGHQGLSGPKSQAPIKYIFSGVLSQATKNKTYTPKNICSGVSKDRSHGEYLPSFMLREQGGRGFEYNENNFKKNN